jgi:multidrug resistance efflux pump
MADEKSLSAIYEARRRARGSEPSRRPPRWRRGLVLGSAVLLAVAALAGGLFVWWSFTHVTTVRATVWAALVNRSPEVDAEVREVCAYPGDKVSQGQVLMRLDDSELRAALAAAEAEKAVRESLCAQAEANLRLAEARVSAAIELAQARESSAKAALELRQARLAEEIRGAEAERDQAKAQLEHLRKGARPEEVETAKVRLGTAQAQAGLCEIELRQSEELCRRGIDSPQMVEVKKIQWLTRKNEQREAELTVARLTAGPAPEEVEASARALAAREAAVALARAGSKEVEVLAADLAMRQAELKGAEAGRLEVALERERVNTAAAERRKAESAAAQARAALEKGTRVTSPVNGTVVRTLVRAGEVCRRGVPAVLVAEDAAGRWVEGYIRERDAARVKVGQRARVEIVVGSGSSVDAVVEAVGLSTSSVARSVSDGTEAAGAPLTPLVWVKLALPRPRDDALPGMTARATIHVR